MSAWRTDVRFMSRHHYSQFTEKNQYLQIPLTDSYLHKWFSFMLKGFVSVINFPNFWFNFSTDTNQIVSKRNLEEEFFLEIYYQPHKKKTTY